MGIKQYKPTSAGRRAGMVSDFADTTHPRENRPEKNLLAPKPKKGGRNNQGVTTSRFRGGGHKQRYRIVDFKRLKTGVEAKVIAIEYDPNRSARLALLQYKDGEKSYILAPQKLGVGDTVVSANSARRDLVRLVTTDGADSGFGSGTVHLHALLEHLAVIDATGSASLRTMLDVVQRDGQGALVLVVGDTVDDELTSTARLRQRFGLVLIVRAARADHAAGADANPGPVDG